MNYIKSILYSNDTKHHTSTVEATLISNNYSDDNDSDSHNIAITLADKSIESLRILKATGEISRSEEARRLKLLKSFLEYQRECDIEEEVDKTSRSPFLLLHGCLGFMSFFCRCYKIDGMRDDID
jgi:hypothetical protein